MKITLKLDGGTRAAKRPYEKADHVVVTGACPHCGVEPFKAKGRGVSSKDHDSYYAEADCVDCGKFVGTIRAKMDTLFGIEEDERVLSGRYRVY